MSKYTIYTDGACKGNPGPGGWAMQVHNDSEIIFTESGGKHETTNNEMELTAIFRAVDWCNENLFFRNISEVEIISDSDYSIKCITKWADTWMKMHTFEQHANHEIIYEIKHILWNLEHKWGVNFTFTHVNGHVGIPGNESVDKIASEKAIFYKIH